MVRPDGMALPCWQRACLLPAPRPSSMSALCPPWLLPQVVSTRGQAQVSGWGTLCTMKTKCREASEILLAKHLLSTYSVLGVAVLVV